MINQVISKISSMQTGPDAEHGEGLFLSRRENKNIGYGRPDNSIFGTASVVFLLNEIRDLLPEKEQQLVRDIGEKAKRAYPAYKNKDGLETYNFWKTRPSRHFPSGYIFKHFDHFRLPDDIDDTSLIYLNLGHTGEQNVWLKNKLKMHAGADHVYSTWFGKNMPHEQDLCALSNLMYWIFKNDLPLNEMDHNTLNRMRTVILNEEFISNPFKTARHYATPPLIVYHVSRLLFRFEVKALESVRDHLIAYSEKAFEKEAGLLDKVLLSTSLWKLGQKDEKYRIDYSRSLDEDLESRDGQPFYSFIGALLGPYTHPALKMMAGSPLTRINWKCPAHELALCLENMVLTRPPDS